MEKRELQLLSAAMSEYCARNIWNEVRKEDRINIVPMPLSVSPVRNTYRYKSQVIDLPDKVNSYVLYAVPDIFSGAYDRYFDDGWISSETLCNENNLLIHTYRGDGRMLPKGGVWFYSLPNKGYALIAIDSFMWNIVMGDSTDLRLTRYYDSDNHDQIVHTYKITTAGVAKTVRNLATDIKTRYPNGLMVYIDGYYHSDINDITIANGTYVDLIEDQDVVGMFNVDIALGDYGYFSEKDQCDKLIVHVPKALNPKNKLITHNTCTIYVVRKSDGVGTYLHRCALDGITQLTHNDFAIKDFILKAFVADMNFANYTLHIQVRTHQKDNVLMPDAHYINYLYSETDENILGHLRGTLSTLLPFWKASDLENSSYVEMMTNMKEITIHDEDFSYYIDALGYYSTANLMCKHIRSYQVSDKFKGFVRVAKPYILYEKPITPSIFLNGIRLASANVTYQDNGDNTVNFSIKNTPYRTGDSFDISMITGETPSIVEFTPTVGDNVITLPYTSFLMYIESIVAPIETIGITNTKGYEEVAQTAGTVQKVYNDDGTITLTCGISLFNKKLVILRSEYAKVFTNTLSDEIAEGTPFTVDLTLVNEQLETLPALGVKSTDVYLNGLYLVENIDYFLLKREVEGKLVSTQVVVTNYEYCRDDLKNYIEVIAHTTEYVAVVNGYVVDQKLANVGRLVQYYDGLSTVYVEGKLHTDVTDHSRYMTTKSVLGESNPYEICTRIPRVVHDILTDVYPYVDEKLDAINKYFGNRKVPEPDIIYIHDKHKVYSPFITLITDDLVKGKLIAGYDPQTITFLKQFTAYDYLKDADVTLIPNRTGIVLDYVAVRGCYRDMGYSTLDIYKTIERLIKIYIGENTV